jgi:eukaryotic-like serine/threonine-protein kinase
MGEVWRGVHASTGVGVAVKFVLEGGHHLRSAFHNEVAQMARLDHPHIVRVLDQGVVPTTVERASGGDILSGGPWLAMELASAGSLADAPPPRTWAEAQDILRGMLEALAYAHALGVLHRDLKPANVLALGKRDVRPGLKLTDFGLAHVWDDDRLHSGMAMAGTPEFMAPEQAAGALRDQGPWTDLYAVGCVAWQLATGSPPFTADTNREVMRMHMSASLPTLEAAIPVPDGLERWLERMLAKRPGNRFRQAADAMWALRTLGEAAGVAGERSWDSLGGDTWSLFELEQDEEELPEEDAASTPTLAPPMPKNWRRQEQKAPLQLVDAGLGLWGLRPVPLVGREALRDRMWADLRAVAEGGSARGTLLIGPAGYGKTRLSEWLGNRARELGAAHVLWAGHAPIAGPWDGIGRMVARRFRCLDCDPLEARTRIAEGLRALDIEDDFDVSALLSWLWPGGTPVRDSERAAALGRLIRAMGRDRPVLLVADHAQWGPQTLHALDALLATEDLPLYVLLTWQDDGEPHPGATERLQALSVRRETVSELPDEEMQQLVAGLLVLDAGLGQRVSERAAGCPLFAVQLIGDWVSRGVLRVGDAGFELAPGEAGGLPDDIHGMWLNRLAGRSDGEGLEVAAALSWFSDVVSWPDWTGACEAAGVAAPDPEQLAAAGLLLPDEGGWRFVHGMLRESLGRRAEEEGRWRALHAACAQAVDVARPARVGRHLLLAGREIDAMDPLLDGLEGAIEGGQLRTAKDLVELCDPIDLDADDIRRGRRGILAMRCSLAHGDFEAIHARAARLGPRAYSHGWSDVLAQCQRHRGMASEKTGDPLLAQALLEHAARIAQSHDLPLEGAVAQLHLANLARLRADSAALTGLLGAIKTLETLPPTRFVAEGYGILAAVHITLGNLAEGEAAATRAAALFAEHGHRAGSGFAQNELGEIRRKRGDLAEAATAYRRSFQLLDGAGHHARLYPLANLAATELERALSDSSHARAAHAEVSEALRVCTEQREKVLQAYLTTLRLAADVLVGDLAAFDGDHAAATRLLAETGLVEPDLGRLLRAAGEQARDGFIADRLEAIAAQQSPH